MKLRPAILIVLVIASALPLVVAPQDIGEPDVIQTALEITHERCDVLRRDQACYGHALLSAKARLDTAAFNFADEGDIEDLAKIQSLRLSGLDADAGTWGVILMQLRANLPKSQPENVTLIAFGDVALSNGVHATTEVPVTVSAPTYINARMSPSTAVGAAGTLAPGQATMAVERLADSSWLRVMIPDTEDTGWVRADLLRSDGDVNTLNVAERTAPYYQPMQAFYFSSRENDLTHVPTNGLLIQTPEGVGEVQLLINEISIQLGSTVFFEAQPGNQMRVTTLEGHADVRANGVEFTAFAGTMVTVPLDENMEPSGPPSPPQPYDQAGLEGLPLPVFDREIEITPPLTWDEIAAEQAAASGDVSDDDDGSGNNGNNGAGGRPVCPGNSCAASSCAGNSCTPPSGQGQGQSGNAGQNGSGNSGGNGGGNGKGNN